MSNDPQRVNDMLKQEILVGSLVVQPYVAGSSGYLTIARVIKVTPMVIDPEGRGRTKSAKIRTVDLQPPYGRRPYDNKPCVGTRDPDKVLRIDSLAVMYDQLAEV